MTKPNCYQCIHRRDISGDCHSSCANLSANVTGSEHGIRNGWFLWPFNFDPTWLIGCDGFEAKEKVEEVTVAAEIEAGLTKLNNIYRKVST